MLIWRKRRLFSYLTFLFGFLVVLICVINYLLNTSYIKSNPEYANYDTSKQLPTRDNIAPENSLDGNCNCSAIRNDNKPHIYTDVPEKTEAIQPLLMLSWTAQNMNAKSHGELWYGDGSSLDNAFQACYDGKFLDPAMYPCRYTNNRTYLERSDVVLFRARLLAELALPNHHPKGQHWLFYDFEPPYKVWERINLTQYNGVFNITSTYSRDSDIPMYHDMRNCVKHQDKYNKLVDVDYMRKKTRKVPVAWFVSVCKTQSKREQYVKELQKYIDVDIYGKCGSLKCGGYGPSKWETDNCDDHLLHDDNSYMFYLAFENSLCDDYVTEKFVRMLKIDIVPVFMGAVDYSNMLPKDSFIDVRDFPSPKLLAAHLQRLMNNRTLYNEYIRNKNSLNCASIQDYKPRACLMCKRLHELRGHTKVVHNLDRFWGSRRCIAPTNFYRENSDNDFDFKSQLRWHE